MSIRVRRSADALDIARVHEKLGLAHRLLSEAANFQEAYRARPLSKSSQTTVYRMTMRIGRMVYDLEMPFMRATGCRDAPFASLENPTAWIEWLDKHEHGGT